MHDLVNRCSFGVHFKMENHKHFAQSPERKGKETLSMLVKIYPTCAAKKP